jgi:Leucine-rich repeat (LRR) protein
MAFCKVFSQSIQWESAINLDPLSVTILDCSGQKWDSLPFEIFQFTNLKELDLSKNKLSQIPEKFNSFQAIEKLDLGRNKFENFPLVICQFPHLKTLHLDRNQITLLISANATTRVNVIFRVLICVTSI